MQATIYRRIRIGRNDPDNLLENTSPGIVMFNCHLDPLSAKYDNIIVVFNPLGPHDALKHHFKSLKTDLILLQL